MEVKSSFKTPEITINAKVIRADGTVEELGTIYYFSNSWIKRLLWKIKNFIKRMVK